MQITLQTTIWRLLSEDEAEAIGEVAVGGLGYALGDSAEGRVEPSPPNTRAVHTRSCRVGAW